MSQKMNDLKLMLQNDRRIWAAAGFVVVLLLIWTLSMTGSSRPAPQAPPVVQQIARGHNPGNGATEAYNDLTRAFREDIEELQRSSADNAAVVAKLSREMSEYKQQSTGIFQTLVDRMEELNKEIDRLAEASSSSSAQAGLAIQEEDADQYLEADTLEPIGFDTTDIPVPPAPPEIPRIKVISPGDVVRLQLLTGVNAPVDGTPYPVVFKLIGPVTGPDGSSLDIGEARLIAAAQGSETDGRVLYRLTRIAMRHPDGRRSVVPVDGWIVGEDGIRGMKGRLIDKLGRLIAATAGVSFVAAMADTLESRAGGSTAIVTDEGVFDLDGNDFDNASASAITDGANRAGEIILDRYEKLTPVVEVLSGREVVAVFSSSAEIGILDESDDEGIYAASALD